MSRRIPTATFVLVGLGLVLGATRAPGQAAAPAQARYEHRIVQDVSAAELAELAGEGWEYVGYLGQGVKGEGNDETLWRRAR